MNMKVVCFIIISRILYEFIITNLKKIKKNILQAFSCNLKHFSSILRRNDFVHKYSYHHLGADSVGRLWNDLYFGISTLNCISHFNALTRPLKTGK